MSHSQTKKITKMKNLHNIIQKNMESFDEKFGENSELAKFLTLKYGTHIHHAPMFNAIKELFLSSQLSIIQAIDEWAEQMKEKCPEGFEQCFETHKEHKEVLSDLHSFLNEAKNKLQ